MKVKYTAVALLITILSACATQKLMTEQEMLVQHPTLAQAKTSIEAAERENLALYSPVQLKNAENIYQNALEQAQNSSPKVKDSASEVIARIETAKKQAVKAKYVFEEVFNARDRAINVNASSAAPAAFKKAESELAKVLALLEVGEDEKAIRDVNALRNQYLDIELNSLKRNMLSVAEQALTNAKKNDLADIAPSTMAMAEDEYRLALATIEADRTDTQKANVHANRAIWLVQKAKGIVDIETFFKNANFDAEQKILWYQDQLSQVVKSIDTDVGFNQPNKEVVNKLSAAVANVVEERKTLLMGMESAETKQTQLAKDKAEAKMEYEQAQAQKRADDERFSRVQSMYSPEEANVYRQLNNVLIRAQGFAFKSGSSEIESSNFILLNKIIEAIKNFPGANIMVSGHTDNLGSEELNMALSQARAQTVANFITQVGLISKDKVDSSGFGKNKPVASNETAEGRAENRRVEILIIND
ncbi:OmpA family protein [Colwellia sp. MB3u-70]|uniref:OmpA family protein n=1 Tax=unclassified Colwellia TaxID=196834 RepID=UPI0015F6E2AB|nr:MULTISPECIES: OmpA family protein [unclassified Colwellia]MBA6292975.1 OmpA family protein [Colwellia sp. MB3u-8]MBA6306556.1 OmpA family protein [Colwellia sp. MB3u-70]